MAQQGWAELQGALMDLHEGIVADEDTALSLFREWCHGHVLEIAVFALRAQAATPVAGA